MAWYRGPLNSKPCLNRLRSTCNIARGSDMLRISSKLYTQVPPASVPNPRCETLADRPIRHKSKADRSDHARLRSTPRIIGEFALIESTKSPVRRTREDGGKTGHGFRVDKGERQRGWKGTWDFQWRQRNPSYDLALIHCGSPFDIRSRTLCRLI